MQPESQKLLFQNPAGDVAGKGHYTAANFPGHLNWRGGEPRKTVNLIFLSLLSFVKIVGPYNEKKEWTRLSHALKDRLAPLHQDIGRASTDFPEYIETLGDRLSKEIRDFLWNIVNSLLMKHQHHLLTNSFPTRTAQSPS